MILEEIERLIELTRQDTDAAWEAANVLDQNNQFRDWFIERVKELSLEVRRLEAQGRVDIQELQVKVKSLEVELSNENAKVKSLISDLEKLTTNFLSLAKDFAKERERVKSLETELRSGKLCCHPLCLSEKVQLTENLHVARSSLRQEINLTNKYFNACNDLNGRITELEEGIRNLYNEREPEGIAMEELFKLIKEGGESGSLKIKQEVEK